jgi:hypothetical protein
MSLFRVLETPLDVAAASAAVSGPEIGGIDLFLGAVRDHNDGRPVTLLEYHAYVSMAEKEMQRIAAEIAAAHSRSATWRSCVRLAPPTAAKPFAHAGCSSIASKNASLSGSASTVPPVPTGSAGRTPAASRSTATTTTSSSSRALRQPGVLQLAQQRADWCGN